MTDEDITQPYESLQEKWRRRVIPYLLELTNDLRSSSRPPWKQLRDRLAAANVLPEDAAVANLHEEDVATEFGIVVARDGRGFLFEFRYPNPPNTSLDNPEEEAWVSRWEELDNRGLRAHARELEVARSILAVPGP